MLRAGFLRSFGARAFGTAIATETLWSASRKNNAHTISSDGRTVTTTYGAGGIFGVTGTDNIIPPNAKVYFELETIVEQYPMTFYAGLKLALNFSPDVYYGAFYAVSTGAFELYTAAGSYTAVTPSPTFTFGTFPAGTRFGYHIDTTTGDIKVTINGTQYLTRNIPFFAGVSLYPVVGTPASDATHHAQTKIHGGTTCAYTPDAGYTYLNSVPVHTYTTLNPSDKGSTVILSSGNLQADCYQNGAVRSTVGVSSGKWYWEHTSTGRRGILGIGGSTATLSNYPGSSGDSYAYYGGDGVNAKAHNGQTTYGSTWTPGNTIGVALDLDNGTLEFYQNGVSMGVAFTGISGTYYAMVGGDTNTVTCNITANFGATPFNYPVPAGYNAGLYT